MHLYTQIADILREKITSGELAPGAAMPSEEDLVTEYKVSRVTARKAMGILKEEGLVYSQQGHGTYVGPEDAPRAPREIPVYQRIAAEIIGEIKAGKLKENRPIPSEKTMTQRWDVANATARQATAHLRALGWVITVPQKGTFVKPRTEWPES